MLAENEINKAHIEKNKEILQILGDKDMTKVEEVQKKIKESKLLLVR